MNTPIYLDYASTSPLDPRVLEAMQPYLNEYFGNASSIHQFGQVARKAIDEAREKVIQLLGAFSAHEIVFTGSGTESCNMAIMGAAFARQDQGKHLIISAIEHPAIAEPAYILRDHFGFTLTEIKPNEEGFIDPKEIEKALQKDTIFVSVMLANNEMGAIQPVKEIAKLCREKNILFHTDACQAPGYIDLNVGGLGPDLMTLNGSKIYGPKGIGLLYVREGLQILPLIHGGGQEFRMRGGTENVANIVGFAKALELILEESEQHLEKITKMRDQLFKEILDFSKENKLGITLNGPAVSATSASSKRLPNNINIHVPGKSGESLVMRLDMEGLAASSGSACSSGKIEASPVLLAMGQNEEKASQSLRLTLGRPTTEEELSKALEILKRVLGS
jgi:cysteine desulfurase